MIKDGDQKVTLFGRAKTNHALILPGVSPVKLSSEDSFLLSILISHALAIYMQWTWIALVQNQGYFREKVSLAMVLHHKHTSVYYTMIYVVSEIRYDIGHLCHTCMHA